MWLPHWQSRRTYPNLWSLSSPQKCPSSRLLTQAPAVAPSPEGRPALSHLLPVASSACSLKGDPGLSDSATLTVHLCFLRLSSEVLSSGSTPQAGGALLYSSLLLLLTASCYECSFPLVASLNWASQVALVVKNLPANAGDSKRQEFDPWIRKIPWSRKWQPIPIFLPGKFHGQRSLMGSQCIRSQRVGHDLTT